MRTPDDSRAGGVVTADVLVVLGAALYADGTPSRALVRRVRHAARLFAAGFAPRLIMSGGLTAGRGATPPWPESRVMRDLAIAAGVPETAIIEESRSTRTLENALCVREMMGRERWTAAVVVTDGFHLPRALATFRAAGVRCRGAAAPGAWRDEGPGGFLVALLRELGAMIVYAALIASGRLRR